MNPKRWKAFLRNLAIKYLFDEVKTKEIDLKETAPLEIIKELKESNLQLQHQVNYYKQYTQPHIIEQLFIRLQKCDTCVELGYCTHCGCDVPEKLIDLQDFCSQTEEKILTQEEWSLIRLKKIKECLN